MGSMAWQMLAGQADACLHTKAHKVRKYGPFLFFSLKTWLLNALNNSQYNNSATLGDCRRTLRRGIQYTLL